MGNPALKLVTSDYSPEYGDGDGGDIDIICCPECECAEFCLEEVEGDKAEVVCVDCGCVVGEMALGWETEKD